MRIVSGSLGGLFLQVPNDMPHTRPTTQVAKEGLFNILNNYIDFSDLSTLDLFGGTGSISYELASRGAKHLTIIEKDPKMNAFIKKSIDQMHIKNATVMLMDVFQYLKTCKQQFDFIFAGPPYALEQIEDIPNQIIQYNLLHTEGIFVLEHTPKNNFLNHTHCRFQRNYGTTVFSFFLGTPKNHT